MSGYRNDGRAGRARSTTGGAIASVRAAVEQFRSPSGAAVEMSANRGDVRAAVLRVLAEEPGNGYRIVRVLAERGQGGPTPTAGSVYPTLQLLADEGLATAAETDGRKTWTLTDAGQVAAAAAQRTEREFPETSRGPQGRGALSRTAAQLVQTAVLVAQSGTPDQVSEAAAVLDRARRDLIAILARS